MEVTEDGTGMVAANESFRRHIEWGVRPRAA
jgi:hypothetical protein